MMLKTYNLYERKVNNIDWDLFLELAMHHRLYPLLSGKLKR